LNLYLIEDFFKFQHLTISLCRLLADHQTFDKTRPAFFRGYGKETFLEPHPCLDEEWSTTFRKTYLKPLSRSKPNIYQKRAGKDIEFDEKMKESYRYKTKATGFQANS
jgi:hypothetical protein